MSIRKIHPEFRYLNINSNEMATVDQLKNELIDKILSIKDKDFLEALDKLITTGSDDNFVEITMEQKELLEMSERDIKEGNLISQEAITERNLQWLNEW